ncbi:hypothetical protein PV325_006664, partial [Microctonus aethiopoides]
MRMTMSSWPMKMAHGGTRWMRKKQETYWIHYQDERRESVVYGGVLVQSFKLKLGKNLGIRDTQL